MEKAAAAGARAGTRWEMGALGAWAAFGLAACVAGPAAWAGDAAPPDQVVVAQAHFDIPLRVQLPAGDGPRLEVQTSTLPRLDAQDSGYQAPRVDVTLLPAHHASGISPVLGVGGLNQTNQPALAGLPAMRTSVDLGLRWSQRLSGQQHVDVTAWRRMNTEYDAYTLTQMQQPVYGARVELNLAPVHKAGFSLDHGFIGVQLESGARISVKRKDGHPMLYYRTAF